jgi:hypothetical protein
MLAVSCAVTLVACGGGKKTSSGRSGTGPGSEVDPSGGQVTPIGKVAWLFQGFQYPFKPEHGNDAVTYTYGSMKLKAVPTIDGFALSEQQRNLVSALTVKKFLLLQSTKGAADPVAALAADDQALLQAWCTNLQVTLPDGNNAGLLGTDEFHVFWQSHFSPDDQAKLGTLLLAAGVRFQCGLVFAMDYQGASATEYMHLGFDPAPDFDPVKIHPGDLYTGTDRFVVARNESVMLPLTRDQKTDPFAAEWKQLPVDGDPDIRNGVFSLNADDFASDPVTESTGESCNLRLTDAMKVVNPDDEQSVSVTIGKHPTRSYRIKSAGFAPLPGKTMPEVCKTLTFKVAADDSYQIGMNCSQVRDMLQGGDCGVKITYENPEALENSVEKITALSGTQYELLDLAKPVNAASLLPEAQDNPIRTPPAGMTLTQFSATQLAELARSFDLWQLTSGTSYVTYFKDQISEIIYDTGSANCDGAGAYAQLNVDKIYWCPGGGLAGEALMASKSPYYLLYRASTALHEALHTRGNYHDIDNALNQPCSPDGGTAYSAVIAVDTYNCTEDVCYGFRDLARDEFLLELNYSLKDDARRFQGQCDIWAKQLGVAF